MTNCTARACIAIMIVALAAIMAADAEAQIRKQFRNGDTPQSMTPAELAELGDPMFLLVLKDQPDVDTLKAVEELIQPDAAKRRLFVVGEQIIDSSRPSGRRAVITFEGTRPPNIHLRPNVMLSVVFSSESFPEAPPTLPFIEAWGWDQQRARFNYYKLDRSNGESAMTWKFRGSSAQSDISDQTIRDSTCFRCHINGQPLMKELDFPWNNWHSQASRIPYLDRNQPANIRWPVTANARFERQGISDRPNSAADLERDIISVIQNASQELVKRRIRPDPPTGGQRISGARTLLKHLFRQTEFNMVSWRRKSNMHPLSGGPLGKPGQAVQIPSSFFLNAKILGNGNLLGIARAIGFPRDGIASVTPDEYRDLVLESGVMINGVPGDADFAWLVPEPSLVDNQMIEELVKSGAVHRQYLAAVMAIDLKQPLLSKERSALFEFVPDSYVFRKPAAGADPFDTSDFAQHALTRATINRLEAVSPTGNTRLFLDRLKMTNGAPRDLLMADVDAYAAELKAKLRDGSAQERKVKLQELYNRAISQRKAILAHPMMGKLDETRGRLLFPLP